MDISEIESLRTKFRPKKIRVLFVGESVPPSGTFFYAENSQAYREFKRVFGPLIAERGGFLDAFKANGFFLDDLVLGPPAQRTKRERKLLRDARIPNLARRISEYQPDSVVAIMKALHQPVSIACQKAKLHGPFFSVSYPGNGRQKEFRQGISEILPLLLPATFRS